MSDSITVTSVTRVTMWEQDEVSGQMVVLSINERYNRHKTLDSAWRFFGTVIKNSTGTMGTLEYDGKQFEVYKK